MVRARYTIDDNAHTLEVAGHANYAEYGKDIVCAGVSSLVQALIGWLEENYDKADGIRVDAHEGRVVVSCEGGEDVSAVFNMTYIGLAQIADSYPDHVEIDVIGLAD